MRTSVISFLLIATVAVLGLLAGCDMFNGDDLPLTPSFDSVSPINVSVPFGISLNDIFDLLPDKVEVIDDEGNTYDVLVDWDIEGYEQYSLDSFKVVSTFTLPEGLLGEDSYEVEFDVTVQEPEKGIRFTVTRTLFQDEGDNTVETLEFDLTQGLSGDFSDAIGDADLKDEFTDLPNIPLIFFKDDNGDDEMQIIGSSEPVTFEVFAAHGAGFTGDLSILFGKEETGVVNFDFEYYRFTAGQNEPDSGSVDVTASTFVQVGDYWYALFSGSGDIEEWDDDAGEDVSIGEVEITGEFYVLETEIPVYLIFEGAGDNGNDNGNGDNGNDNGNGDNGNDNGNGDNGNDNGDSDNDNDNGDNGNDNGNGNNDV